MSKPTNIDKLVEDYILSSYVFKKSTYGHDMLFNNGSNKIDGLQLITEIKLIFDYDALKTFNLVTRWAHSVNPNILLFEFWNTNQYFLEKLPDYMRKPVTEYDFSELYQDFYLETIDS